MRAADPAFVAQVLVRGVITMRAFPRPCSLRRRFYDEAPSDGVYRITTFAVRSISHSVATAIAANEPPVTTSAR